MFSRLYLFSWRDGPPMAFAFSGSQKGAVHGYHVNPIGNWALVASLPSASIHGLYIGIHGLLIGFDGSFIGIHGQFIGLNGSDRTTGPSLNVSPLLICLYCLVLNIPLWSVIRRRF